MKDKKQDVKSLEELLKVADDFRKWAIDFGNELSKVLADIKALKKEEDTWEMKCPYKIGDNYWIICDSGEFEKVIWNDYHLDKEVFIAGNAFLTKEAAELEAKRRNLLTRFRAFRDECNNGWKPDWSNSDEKWEIDYTEDGVKALWTSCVNSFSTFGYFKNKQDTQRAIELFGDEIQALFVDLEEN